jgi:hypothetical protein
MAQVNSRIFIMSRREDAKNKTLLKTSHFKEYFCSERKARREKESH